MPYPNNYIRQGDFSRDDSEGLEINTTLLDAEYNGIQNVLAQLNKRIRDITTATGELRLDLALRSTELFEVEEFTATANQTVYTFTTPIDSSRQLIRLFVDGVRVQTSLLTITDTDVTFPALGAGELGSVEVYSDGDGALVLLADDTPGSDGALIVGWGDINSRTLNVNLPNTGSPDTVEGGLDLAFLNLISLATGLLPASQWLRADGSVVLTDHWFVNDRVAGGGFETPSTGQIRLISNPVDGETVTVNDGFLLRTYEFDDDATVALGNIAVAIGIDIQATGTNLGTAISVGAQAFNVVEVDNATTYDVNLTNQLAGIIGNHLITEVSTSLVITGLAGGSDLSSLEALLNQCRIRNLPPSVRNGDVVVHEQLTALNTLIDNLVDSFVRTDGTSAMTGNLDLGGQKVIQLADGTSPNDGVNKDQLDAVEEEFDRFIPILGAQDPDSAAQATGIGSLSFSESATAIADVPQDSGAGVQTFSGVPRPGAPDHVVNLEELNLQAAGLQTQINNLEGGGSGGGNQPDGTVSVGSSLAGCVLDGTGLGSPVPDINAGGIFNFDELTVIAAQTPAEDTFIFVDGDIAINGNITMALRKLQISVTGNITVDAAATITCRDLVMRAGGDIIVEGDLVAAGDIQTQVLNANANVTFNRVYGILGFISLTAGGKCDLLTTASVDTTFLNVQAGASSIVECPIVVESKAFVEVSNHAPALSGITLGRNGIFAYGSATNAARVLLKDHRSGAGLLSGVGENFNGPEYSGGGGALPTVPGLGSHSPGGGGGGRGGGNGAPPFNSAINGPSHLGKSRAQGVSRVYLYPLGPGGCGGTVGSNQNPADGRGGRSGGTINIHVAGDLVLTGAAVQADALNAAGADGGSGAGGGCIRVVASGMITDGTLSADGSQGSGAGGTRGGGGGAAHLVASAFAGVQTLSAAAGANAQAGETGAILMPQADIECLASEGYWRQ